MTKIYPVILCGGSGTRLWPISRAALPKQLLPLVSQKTMFQETVLRLAHWQDIMPPLVVCGSEHRFLVAEQLREIGINPLNILLEPAGRNTAPAIAVAAHYLLQEDPDALMLVLPADHVIGDVDAFRDAVTRAQQAAAGGNLTTFGIVPTHPETGYGYIREGAPLAGVPNCYVVDQFLEKPELAIAREFVQDGRYCWNSGMFLFHAAQLIEELKKFASDLVRLTSDAVTHATRDLEFCRLDQEAFLACQSISIDYAVMEKTQRAVVVPAEIGWNDVGSWSSLWKVQKSDENGNVLRGDVYVDNVQDSIVRAESRIVAVVGLKDVVVVETADAVLVTRKEDCQRTKDIVDYLKRHSRQEHETHTRVYRPWGWYEGVDSGDNFQVKRITVKPGEKLSLQMHFHRAEHWVVVQGTALVTCDDVIKLLTPNESVYIPIGSKHRLENPGKVPLHLIEIQSGGYLGEDDIVRFEDIYQRA